MTGVVCGAFGRHVRRYECFKAFAAVKELLATFVLTSTCMHSKFLVRTHNGSVVIDSGGNWYEDLRLRGESNLSRPPEHF